MGSVRSNAEKLATSLCEQTTDLHDRGNKTRTKYIKSVKDLTQRDVSRPVPIIKDQRPVVTKGRWRGYPVFTLTLEERATCPSYCEQWDECYGNNMPFGARLEPHTSFVLQNYGE